MNKQNEIKATSVHQQSLLPLPVRDIPVFDWDPLQYYTLIKAFKQGVEEKANIGDCLHYLEQYTRGQPRELVCSCQHINPDQGYIQAKEPLQKHCGNEYKIASAYMYMYISIKLEDVNALQGCSLFLVRVLQLHEKPAIHGRIKHATPHEINFIQDAK